MKTNLIDRVWRILFILVFVLGTVWTPGTGVRAKGANDNVSNGPSQPAVTPKLGAFSGDIHDRNYELSTVSSEKQDRCFNHAITTSTDPHTGKVKFVGAAADRPILQITSLPATANDEQAARHYLRDCGSLFGLTDESTQLRLEQQTSRSERAVVRFQQMHKSIPIFAGELVIQLNSEKNIVLVNGHLSPLMKIDTKPALKAKDAQDRALEFVANEQDLNIEALTASNPELWIYNPRLIMAESGPTALVWRIEVTTKELAPIDYLILVDAHTGSTQLSINQVDTAKNRETYTADNTTIRPGTLVCDESNPDCTGGDTDAINAHVYAGDTYDFYFNNHGRDSIDNTGMTMISTTHYSINYCNAFWNGVQMTYGDGCFIVVDDVVAHEITHGVTEFESGLIYINESGAINESFSDIWGEWIDLTNGRGTDTPEVRWYQGEDVSGGAGRYLKDPTEFGHPDRIGSPNYYIGTWDNGGVHVNSGVGNKAAYLITDGDTFNGYEVTGLGIAKAAKIYYEAQTNILTSGSDYGDLYNALYQACNNLVGTSGITTADCQEVRDATDATEMNVEPAYPLPPANDDFDSPQDIGVLPYTNTQNQLFAATTAADDPVIPCFGDLAAHSVWYRYAPASTGVITIDTAASNYDTVLAVWTGGRGSLTNIACNDDIDYSGGNYRSRVTFNAVAGQTYFIEAASWGYDTDTLVLNATVYSPPTECTSGLCVLVNDSLGNPVPYAQLEVYTNLSTVPVAYGTTNSVGYVQINVNPGNYTLVGFSFSEQFLVVKDVVAPQLVTLDPTGTVPVTVSARKLDNTPLDAQIEIRPSPYSSAALGRTDSNGELAGWVTPGNYAFLAWSWTDRYHLGIGDVNIASATNVNLHAADMPTGQVTINLSNFDNGLFAVWCDLSPYYGIAYNVIGGETFVFSARTYNGWFPMRKWEGSDLWEYSTNVDSLILTEGQQLTINRGGDFYISTNVNGSSFNPGQQVSTENRIEDSFGNRIASITVDTNAARSQNQITQSTVTRHTDGSYEINGDNKNAAALPVDIFPSITVKDPSQAIISQAQDWETWYSHQFTLPDPGMTGMHTVTLSLDTGPHMGVITADDTFMVNDAPPLGHIDAWYRDGNINAYAWPLGSQLTLEIEDPATPQSPDYSATIEVGVAPWNPNETLGEFHLNGAFVIEPGMTLRISGASMTKELVISNLTITSIDQEMDIITGNSEPNQAMWMYYDNASGNCCRDFQADESGVWMVDYSQPGPNGEPVEDIHPGSSGTVNARDDDGDNTSLSWNVPNPNFDAWYQEGRIDAYDWPFGTHLALEIEDPATTTSPDYFTGTDVNGYTDWDPNVTLGTFNLNGIFDIGPGMSLTISGVGATKQLVIANLAITNIDQERDIITGTAEPNQMMWMWYNSSTGTCCRDFQADENGVWVVNYSQPGPNGEPVEDIRPGSSGTVNAFDNDWDTTSLNWNVPNPNFAVRANDNNVEAYQWTMGSTITLEVDDPGTTLNPDYLETRLVDEVAPWDPSQTYEWFGLTDVIDIQPGFVVSITDGVTTKTHTVTSLAFTEINIGSDTVTGVAEASSHVDIWACGNSGPCINRHVDADGSGVWMADFSQPGDEGDEQNTFDITYSTWVDSSQSDEDGDSTMFGQSTLPYTVHAVPSYPEVHGHDWPLNRDVTLTIDDDTDPNNGVLYTQTKNVSDNPWCGQPCFDLQGVFTLEVGQYVSMSDGQVTKTVQVSTLHVTEVNPEADTISGVADPGSRVAVNIWSQEGAARYETADANGNWVADFSVFGDEDFEQFTANLTHGDDGRAIQLNPDGTDDGTLEYWDINWIAPDTIPLVAAIPGDVDLNRPSYTVESWLMLNELYEPFYRVTEDGTLVPAAAVNYTVSPDGLVYTITLRDGMLWSDGQPVTAQQYKDGILRLLNPETASEYALLLFDIQGAEAYNNGSNTDPNSVGVAVLNDTTLQVTLAHQAVYFPQVLAITGIFPVRLDLIATHGNAWMDAGNFAGNGPYTLLEHDRGHFLLQKNPYYYDAASVSFAQVGLDIIPDANEQFEAYKRGEIDVVLDAPTAALNDPNYDANRVYSAQPGVSYIGLNVQRAPTDNSLVRKALAAATSRRTILDQVLNTPWREEATGVIPPELPGYQGSDVGYGYNPTLAQELLSQAGYPGGVGLPTIHLYGSSNNQALLDAIAEQWRTVLNITVETHYPADYESWMAGCEDDPSRCAYNGYRLGWLIDYFDPHNVINDAFNPMNSRIRRTGWDNARYRELIDLSRGEQNEAQRTSYFEEADQILVEDDAVLVPIFFYDRVSLVKPGYSTTFGLIPYFEQWSAAACYTLTTNVDPAGSGSIAADPAPNCPTEPGKYIENTEVTLTANPNAGWVFTNWTGNASGTDNPVTVAVDGDKTVTANFDPIPMGPWSMYGHDSAHSGYSLSNGPNTADFVWSYALGERAQDNASPVVGPDGTIYMPSEDGFFALNPDGTLKWSKWVNQITLTRSAPAIASDGTIYVTKWPGDALFALDPTDGTTLWSYPIGRTTYGSPTIGMDGTIYIGNAPSSGNSSFYALNSNGTLKWSWDSGSACGIESSAAIGPNGDVYFQHNCLGLVSLNSSGELNWTYSGAGDAWNSPSVGPDGTIYLADSDHYFYAFNPDGTLNWRAPVENWMYESSSVISADGSTIYRGDNGGVFYAFDSTGTVKWQYDTGITGSITSAPALSANGIIYFTQEWRSDVQPSDKGYVYALRAADGSLLWQYEIGWSSSSPAMGADGSLYVTGSDGSNNAVLYAFECADGLCELPAESHTLTINKGGTGSGTVTSDPAGIDCGSDCSEVYAHNTIVTLTAIAGDGSTFTGWEGCTSSDNTCTVTMDGDKSVTATFTATSANVIYDDGDAGWTYTGSWVGWNTSGPYLDTLHYSYSVGDTAELNFTGRQIKLTYAVGVGGGLVEVFVDGEKLTTLDQNSAEWYWQRTWTSDLLPEGYHTLRLVLTSASYITLDAVEVIAEPVILREGVHDDGTVWTYNGNWVPWAIAGPYGDTLHYTYQVGDSAQVAFNGQQIRLTYFASPMSGMVEVYVDGVKVATLDQSSPYWEWQKIWTSDLLPAGEHNLRLVFVSGPGSVSFTSVDAIEVIEQPVVLGNGKYDDENAALSYSGLWGKMSGVSGPYADTLSYSYHVGDTIQTAFSGRQLKLSYLAGEGAGVLEVYVDGVQVDSIDQSSSSWAWQKSWTSDLLPAGTHNLRLVFASGLFTSLDSIEVITDPIILTAGTYDDANAAFTYDGSWTAWNITGPYADTLHYTYGLKDSIQVNFTGQQVQVSYLASPEAGILDVYVDGEKVGSLDQHSDNWEWQQSWTSELLTAGEHSLRLVYASGPTTWSFTSLDAITVTP